MTNATVAIAVARATHGPPLVMVRITNVNALPITPNARINEPIAMIAGPAAAAIAENINTFFF
jgi:hypothetical protein